jgi:hypothetical protein
MTYAAPEPVPSGRAFAVISVGGQEAGSLEQFVGDTVFTIRVEGSESTISGLGTLHESGVRFYEKDVEHDHKDVRVWQIAAEPGQGFSATATAAF